MRHTALALALVVIVLVAGCEREQRRFTEKSSQAHAPAQTTTRLSPLSPGLPQAAPPSTTPPALPPGFYDENAWGIAEGQRLYVQLNCNGCHGNGGGGMGVPLIDDKWRYGSEPQNVYATIVQGRPNGMPSYAGKIPEQQVWQLVAYVRALGGLGRIDAAPNRSDSLSPGFPPPAMMDHFNDDRPKGDPTGAPP